MTFGIERHRCPLNLHGGKSERFCQPGGGGPHDWMDHMTMGSLWLEDLEGNTVSGEQITATKHG